jgi:RHS repeat-associated protein
VTGGSGTAVPSTSYGYHATTGLPTTIGNGTVTLTSGYDALGRVVSYSEGVSGPSVTTAYDSHGRVGTRVWKTTPTTTLASASYEYDGTPGEYRGVLTKITDTALPGPITGVYGPGGELARQTLPGTPGITQAFTTDATGDTVSTTWADGVGNLFLGDAQVSDVHGRWAQQTLTGATPGWEQRGYGYDPAGRLTRVGETREDTTGCTTRSYAFDVNSNRTSTTSYPDGGAGCTTSSTPTSTQTLVYDSADRLLSSGSAAGVGYDAWGRITTLPAGLTGTPAAGAATVGYHVNDLARSTTQGGVTRAWTLDPAGRLASMGTTGAGSTALANHYADAGTDSPDWTLDTSSGGTATTRRYLDGLTGGLTVEAATTGGATTLTAQLVGLHGDILRTTTLTATGSPDGPGIDTNEYGVVRDTTGAPTTGPRHGWLGGHQRPADTGNTGLILMGVRLYAPLLGRFLQTDPIYGGNPNTYTYPVDPVGDVDLDGRSAQRAAEVAACAAIGLGACGVAIAISKAVKAFTDRFYGGTSFRRTQRREAARHFIWNLLLMGSIGLARTIVWTNAHEAADWGTADSRRDRRNNAYARRFVGISAAFSIYGPGGVNGALARANGFFRHQWSRNRGSFACRASEGGPAVRCSR